MPEVNYNSNQDLDLDGKMMISVGGIPIAFATTAKMTITTDMVDTTNMMSGDWKDEIPGVKSFTLSSEALITRKTDTVSADSLVDSQLADSLLTFQFGEFKRTGDETAGYAYALDTTKPSYTGSMRISSMELNGENSKLKKYSMSANGCGPLTKVDAVAGG
jgi:hypothetical protein